MRFVDEDFELTEEVFEFFIFFLIIFYIIFFLLIKIFTRIRILLKFKNK